MPYLLQIHEVPRDNIMRLASGVRLESDQGFVQIWYRVSSITWKLVGVSHLSIQAACEVIDLSLQCFLVKLKTKNGVLLIDNEWLGCVLPLVVVDN